MQARWYTGRVIQQTQEFQKDQPVAFRPATADDFRSRKWGQEQLARQVYTVIVSADGNDMVTLWKDCTVKRLITQHGRVPMGEAPTYEAEVLMWKYRVK